MGRGALAALVVAALAFACKRPSPPPPRDLPLAVELSGCEAVVALEADGAAGAAGCALGEARRVRMLIPGSGGRVEIAAGDALLDAQLARSVAGAELFTVVIPGDVRSLEVRRIGPLEQRSVATVSFVPSPRPSWYAAAQKLRQEGKLDEAEARARGATAASSLVERAASEGILARIALRRGEIDESTSRFRAAIALDEQAGLISDRADDAFALAFVLHQRARCYAEARQVLDELGPRLVAYPDGRAREPLYRAQLAWESGDTRSAARDLHLAVERAERLGAEGIARAARQVRAMVACTAGSARACVTALREADRELERGGEGATACERAEVVISLGFAELEHAEASGEASSSRLGEADERGLRLLDQGCPDPYMRAVALEHLAMAAVRKGDVEGAKTRLREAKSFAPVPRIGDAIMWLDIEGRIRELEGVHAAALDAFERARALARGAALRTQEWRALVARGRVLEAAGRPDAALVAHREAETVLDDVVRRVPFGEGRASAVADGGESSRRAAGILIARQRPIEALEVIRRARSRLVRSLAISAEVAALDGASRARWDRAVAEYRDARAAVDEEAADDWQKSRPALDAALLLRTAKLDTLRARLDDAMLLLGGARGAPLPAVPEEETLLAFARVGPYRDVVGFVSQGGTTRTFAVGPLARGLAPSVLGGALLGGASAEIERATRLRIITDDALAWIDVHALPLAGRPLVARAPVVYAADVASASGSQAPSARAVALVVADPTGDLPSARTEGAAVVARLAPHYDARALVGRDATSPRVRAGLSTASLFHYAGHGVFRGREGAESALPLAQGGALTLGDVFTLGRVPAEIVLSGCEAGRPQGDDDEGAANMALAFLVAGARSVIAPVRVVDDRAAGALAAELHHSEDAEGFGDLPARLRSAQLRAARDGRPGWEAFRAFVR
jgi:cellulose synthase operon protein C